MKTILLTALLFFSACATLTSGSGQDITVTTKPAGAACTLHNKAGQSTIAQTPGVASVTRDFSPLTIDCQTQIARGSLTLESQTRGRAYGNILLLGIPATVDAATGKGYEYDPDTVTISLH